MTLGLVAQLCSCTKTLDPFTGSMGVRANINGEKYILITNADRTPNGHLEGNSFTMKERLTESRHLDLYDSRKHSNSYDLSFDIHGEGYLTTGVSYSVGPEGFSARLSAVDGMDQAVPLRGRIRFYDVSTTIEAEFELESERGNYVLRHGFCRLQNR